MKQMEFTTPLDHSNSRYTGWTRGHWEEAFKQMFTSIYDSASLHGARQRIPGPRSHHGLLADELEGFTRSFILAGPWLMNHSTGVFKLNETTYDVGAFYKKGILNGTNPKHPEYWGDIYDYAQHLVEMASLAWSLYQGKQHIWDNYSDLEKKQVASYLNSVNNVKYHQNNWLLFNVITNTVLKKLNMPYSEENLQKNLTACESMYIGEGWYRDGNINRIDYYNSWAFHYYYLIWVYLDGDSNPELAEKHKSRANEFINDFRYFFDKDGSVPCFGRSMIYRFSYLSSVALAVKLGAWKGSLGEVKSMLNLGIKFYMDQPIFSDSGHLSLGFIKPSNTILEHYNCGGSPYWAAKAFNVLMIPEDHELWRCKEEPLPIHKSDFNCNLGKAGLILLGDSRSGHIQLINQKSYHDKWEYNRKYTNFAYSSRFSYESGLSWGNTSCDNSLQYSEDGINYYQRWKFSSLYIGERFSVSHAPTRVNIGNNNYYGVESEGGITTVILVKDNQYFTFHQIDSPIKLTFREGGYPLGYDYGCASLFCGSDYSSARIGASHSFIRILYGWEKACLPESLNNDIQGSNSRYSFSKVPRLEMSSGSSKKLFLAAQISASINQVSDKQLINFVKSFNKSGDEYILEFYDGETFILNLNGTKPSLYCKKAILT